jgi:hypothetical protein
VAALVAVVNEDCHATLDVNVEEDQAQPGKGLEPSLNRRPFIGPRGIIEHDDGAGHQERIGLV